MTKSQSPKMLTECIDAHHHLWKYEQEDYPWISDEMPSLRRDYVLQDLARVSEDSAISGTVVVQARQTKRETEWLLELAEQTEMIRGVVGWAPLIEPDVAGYLEYVSTTCKFKGVRHVLHDEADEDYMLHPDFNAGISQLTRLGLRYDILIFAKQLSQAMKLIDRHPNQTFVLDHIAKPKIAQNEIEPWRSNLKELSRRPNVYCKLSGLVTEANWSEWSVSDLTPYIDAVLESFTPARVMYGSDWPVLNLAATYQKWLGVVRAAIQKLSLEEQQKVLAGTEIKAYDL